MDPPRSPARSSTSPAPGSGPASPSALPASEEPDEHADSPMRKRPRLDGGVEQHSNPAVMSSPTKQQPTGDLVSQDPSSDATVAASEGHAPSSPPTTANEQRPPLTPSKVTLNLRSTDSSPTRDRQVQDPVSDNDSQDRRKSASTRSSDSTEPMQVVVDAPSPSGRSPVVEIIPEPDGGDGFSNMISDDGTPLDQRLLEEFPFSPEWGPAEAATLIAENVSKEQLDVDLLEHVACWIEQSWLKNLDNINKDFYSLYINSQDFWANLANIYWKFLLRKAQFVNLGRATSTEAVARKLELFFVPYVRLCAHLVSVDADMLREQNLQTQNLPGLVSPRHVRNLFMLFRPWNQIPLFKVLWDPLRVPAEQIQKRIALQMFTCDPTGLSLIVDYAKLLTSDVQLASRMSQDIEFMTCAVRYMTNYLREFWVGHTREELLNRGSNLTNSCLDLVRNLQLVLLESPVKQGGLAPDFSFRLLDLTNYLLQDIGEIEHKAAWSVVESEFGELNDISPRDAARLVGSCLHLQVCWKFVAKGRMELRVAGVQTLSSHLVTLWRDFSPAGAKQAFPPFQTIARWIVNQKIVEYLVSVDSHPQLISRSHDVAGFVMVTHHWTPELTAAVWDAIDSSPDPRMIAEILEMLGKIIHLAVPSVIFDFCDKIEHLRSISLTSAMQHFSEKLKGPLLEALRTRGPESEVDVRRPLRVFIRIICDAAGQTGSQPTGGQAAIMGNLQTMALISLQQLSIAANDFDIRKEIYGDCFEEVRSQSQKSMGCLEAILALLDAHEGHDLPYILDEMDLLRQLSENICSFVQETKRDLSEDKLPMGLVPRLRLLARLLFSGSTTSLPPDAQQQLWDHLVGEFAMNDSSRDSAWACFVNVVQRSEVSDPFIDRCINDFILKLHPTLFTQGMFTFVRESMLYSQRVNRPSSPAEGEAIRIPLEDLLWRIILQSPENTIEQGATILLSQYHLDTPQIQKAPVSSVAATHTALMEKCINQLKLAAGRSPLLHPSSKFGESKGHATAESLDYVSEGLYFRRTLQFMTQFIHEVRIRPAFQGSHTLPASPDSDAASANDMKGEPVVIQYQAFESGSQKEVKELKVGCLATISELAEKIRKKTGFVDFKAYLSGGPYDLVKHSDDTVQSIHGKGLFLVRNVGERKSSPLPDPALQAMSVAERSLVNHLDTLYNLLDLDESLSSSLFEFLLAFPPHGRIRDLVLSQEPPLGELFPHGNRVKALYSIRCIRMHLHQLLTTGLDSETFTLQGTQVLTSALTSSPFAPTASGSNFDEEVLGNLVDCLAIFLKQRPLHQRMASCMVNEAAIANELFAMLNYSMEHAHSTVLFNGCVVYACLLEAAYHSDRIRHAIIDQQAPEELHFWLLVNNSSQNTGNGPSSSPMRSLKDKAKESAPPNPRLYARHSIQALCENVPPSVDTPEKNIVSFFWQVLSSLIPQAASRPYDCQEIFLTAKTLFPAHDTLCHDETLLRNLMNSWTDILSTYEHADESPQGRRDEFVLGLSRLLSSCVSFIKSFKKPINAERLIEIVFNRYLFPTIAAEAAEQHEEHQVVGRPIICHETRKELYGLVLAVCENQATYDWLVQRATSLLQTEDQEGSSWSNDTSRWLRSSTGYSGLRNLTNTCYMNSLLTQLFVNSSFRKFMLSVPLSGTKAASKLLNETQRLVANMQNSGRKFAETWAFVEAIQPYDSEHIDITVQMDVDEFYNLLFDRWEGQMPSTEARQHFRSLYGGQLVTQIKSKDCEHVSETVEPFMAIQCDVRGKSTLTESLQAYVEGDTMEGDNKYKCESCNGRFVDAVKRSCLKNLPDNLIFHLKRFDFDLTTLDRHKINDEFQFPEAIDMRIFRVDYINDPASAPDPDIFELVGVLVHNGTAESGHYYSYIRLPSSKTSIHESTWAEFNDTEVCEFDRSAIPEQCFGGTTTHGDMTFAKHHSAYMLFYQRTSAIENDAKAVQGLPRQGPTAFPAPPELETEIIRHNESLSRRFCLFEPTHAYFLRSLFAKWKDFNGCDCSSSHGTENALCRLLLHHSWRVLSRLRDVTELELTISALLRMVANCGDCGTCSLSLLVKHDDVVQDLILCCPSPKGRDFWRQCIIQLLKIVKKQDPLAYGIEAGANEFDISHIYDQDQANSIGLDYFRTFENGIFLHTAHCLEELLSNIGKFIRSWDDYFGLWSDIIDLGLTEAAALLSHGVFTDLLEILHFADSKRLTTGKFRDTHDQLIRSKRMVPRAGLIKAIRSFFAHVNPCAPSGDCSDGPRTRLENYDAELRKFPLEDMEADWILQTNSKGQLILLNRLIDGWDASDGERCAPAEIVMEMLQCGYNATSGQEGRNLVSRIGSSLTTILPEFNTLFTSTALAVCLVFCQTCHSLEEAMPILDEAFNSVEGMKDPKQHQAQRNAQGQLVDLGPQGGMNYLAFFRRLCDMEDANCRESLGISPFAIHVIDRASTWAPPLLMYDEKKVRTATVTFLEQIIFNKYPYYLAEQSISEWGAIPQIESIRTVSNRSLFEACVSSVSRASQMRLPYSFIQSLVAVMTQCASFCDKLSREDSKILQALQSRLDRYSLDTEISNRLELADSCSAVIQRWGELEVKLKEWSYDSEGDEAVSGYYHADTEWGGSSFDELSDVATDGL